MYNPGILVQEGHHCHFIFITYVNSISITSLTPKTCLRHEVVEVLDPFCNGSVGATNRTNGSVENEGRDENYTSSNPTTRTHATKTFQDKTRQDEASAPDLRFVPIQPPIPSTPITSS